MSEWTHAGRGELQRYLDEARRSLNLPEAEADEVLDDLRRHVEEDVAGAGLKVVTGDDVRRITARIGLPDNAAPGVPTGSPPEKSDPALATVRASGRRDWGMVFLLGFGVVLPAVTLFLEWSLGMCAAAFFDPLPTPLHGLLVALVVLGNFQVWRAIREGRVASPRRLGWGNGLALGVAGFYTVLFLPMTPFGLIGVIYLGIGLLPCAPVLAFLSAIFLRRRLRALRPAAEGLLPAIQRGALLGFFALVALNAPGWLTRAGMGWALSEDPATERRGLRWLRAVGQEDALLRACYGRGRGAAGLDPTEWMFPSPPPSPEQARVLYYRVTGRPFNTVPAPAVRTGRGAFAELNQWTWDADQGGDRVGGRLKGLSLTTSRLDVTLDADAAIGYGEWILEFRNDGDLDQEARAQVLLPPGAVVSRLTLWVEGEEREAAFAERGRVREAYRSVAIRQRRDPVLVNTCGPDRILVQCFPVPRRGGTIKTRIGWTAPLPLDAGARAEWRWPVFLERNFNIGGALRHTVWVESTGPVEADSPLLGAGPKAHSLQGLLDEQTLVSGDARVRVHRRPEVTVAWTRDRRAEGAPVVRQTLAPVPVVVPNRVVFVLDGSVGMTGFLAESAAALEEAVAELPWAGVLLATDEPVWLLPPGGTGGVATGWSARLEGMRLRGGADNVPALLAARDAIGAGPDSMMVWVHGPQPVAISSPEALRQRWERHGSGVTLVALPVRPGPNQLLQDLDGLPGVRAHPRRGSLEEDLRGLMTRGGTLGSEWERTLDTLTTPPEGLHAVETTGHLARLWAHGEVERRRRARKHSEAVRLAARYQLVTPVTGAVVLETAQQFADHQLTPADPLTVPSIPEPGVGTLLLAGLVLLLWRSRGASRSGG
ncbi:MAG: hypothetical protein KF833_09620 [Verrucomicrobiae bacterium]|nr:hypothetical protein [Verrucomicrobiae bacterium]